MSVENRGGEMFSEAFNGLVNGMGVVIENGWLCIN